jgi:hypothetical protein
MHSEIVLVTGVAWLVIIFVLIFHGFWRIYSESLSPWKVVYPVEVLLLGVVSAPCYKNDVSSVLPGIQGDCKVNGLDKDRYKTAVGMPSISPAFS